MQMASQATDAFRMAVGSKSVLSIYGPIVAIIVSGILSCSTYDRCDWIGSLLRSNSGTGRWHVNEKHRAYFRVANTSLNGRHEGWNGSGHLIFVQL